MQDVRYRLAAFSTVTAGSGSQCRYNRFGFVNGRRVAQWQSAANTWQRRGFESFRAYHTVTLELRVANAVGPV